MHHSTRAAPLRARSAAGTSARFLWAFRLASVGAAVAMACYIMGYVAADFFGRDAAALKDTSTDYGDSVPPNEAKWTSTGLSTPKDMYIVLSNEYTRDAAADIAVEYGWEAVAEPYRYVACRAPQLPHEGIESRRPTASVSQSDDHAGQERRKRVPSRVGGERSYPGLWRFCRCHVHHARCQ